jgi:hypothetical protein
MSGKHFIALILLVSSGRAFGQRAVAGADTILKGGSTIEVIQAYTPKVKQSPKPEWIPQLPPVDTAHPAVNLDVPQQTLYYTYNSLPLNPLALGKAPFVLPFPNYVKAGGGNLSTLFLDASIGGIYGPNYETAIHLHHLSQKGSIVNQSTSLSGIEAEGTLHGRKSDWHAALIGERNTYHYFGYDHELHNFSEDTIKQTYTTIRAIVDVKNGDSVASAFMYHPSINASVYSGKWNTRETTFGFDVPLSYALDSALDGQVALRGAVTNFTNNSQNENNNYIGVWPGLSLHGEHLGGHALLGLALGKDGNGYVLPDVIATYRAGGNRFGISGGWQSSLRRNTYEELTSENPYMMSMYPVRQTRNDEVFGQLEAKATDHFTFSGRVSWRSYLDLPVFLNDVGDGKLFYIQYQDVKAVSFRAAARYTVADRWSVGGMAEFFGYYNISSYYDARYVWHQPTTRIKGDFEITPVKKLTCGAALFILGGIHARDVNGNVVNPSAVMDASLNAEYQIIPRLSVFAQINNLFNNQYQRWYGYEVYGLNIYGGLRLKF